MLFQYLRIRIHLTDLPVSTCLELLLDHMTVHQTKSTSATESKTLAVLLSAPSRCFCENLQSSCNPASPSDITRSPPDYDGSRAPTATNRGSRFDRHTDTASVATSGRRPAARHRKSLRCAENRGLSAAGSPTRRRSHARHCVRLRSRPNSPV